MELSKLFSKKKRSNTFNYKCSLDVPKFSDSHKVTLKSIMLREDGDFTVGYWKTVNDYLLYHVAQMLLNGLASNDYRRGYMECLSQLHNLPIYDVDEYQDELEDQDTSMMKDNF